MMMIREKDKRDPCLKAKTLVIFFSIFLFFKFLLYPPTIFFAHSLVRSLGDTEYRNNGNSKEFERIYLT